MNSKQITSYTTPLILAVLVFTSDFLDTSLFHFGELNFAIWFILSVFCFGCGWFILKSFGYQAGAKLIFSVSIASSILSVIIVVFFREYFNAANPTVENVILFALRNFFLGAMGFFGLAICEVFTMRSLMMVQTEKLKLIEETIRDAKQESELTIKDAQIRAAKIVNDAEFAAKNIFLKKERVERELREFIQIEKELIKKYEENK